MADQTLKKISFPGLPGSYLVNQTAYGYHRSYTRINNVLTWESKKYDETTQSFVSFAAGETATSIVAKLPKGVLIAAVPRLVTVGATITQVRAYYANGTPIYPFCDYSIAPIYFTSVNPDAPTNPYAGDCFIELHTDGKSLPTTANHAADIYEYVDEGAVNNLPNELSGKKIAFLGDSIMLGHIESGYDKATTLRQAKSCPEMLGELVGAKELLNNSVGGSRLAGSRTDDHKDRVGSISGFDVVFVNGGINDAGASITKVTFKNACISIRDTLIANGNREVVLLSPTTTIQTDTEKTGLQDQYRDAMREVANADSTGRTKFIDLRSLSDNNEFKACIPVATHVNAKGQAMLAHYIIDEYHELANAT